MGRMGRKHPIEKRVAHVLNYKKTKRWKYLIPGIVVVIVGLGVMVQSVSKGATATEGELHTEIKPAIEEAIAKGTQIPVQAASIEAEAPIGVQEDTVFLVEEGESREVIARILKVDLENKSLVVEGLSENSPLGKLCIVSCEPSFVYKQQPDLSQEEYAFEALKEGDTVSLLIDDVEETNPPQTYAGEITWLGSKKDVALAVNYSIAYIPQSGNVVLLENIGEAQKAHIERLITQYVSTSFALSGRGIDEIGDYYLIRCESEGEKEAYLIYQIGGEAYIQQSTYGDVNQIGKCRKISWIDYEEITRWH